MDTALEAPGGTHTTIEVGRKEERWELILGGLYDLVSRPTETGRSKANGSNPWLLRMQICKRNEASRLEEGIASRLTYLALFICLGLFLCNVNTQKASRNLWKLGLVRFGIEEDRL